MPAVHLVGRGNKTPLELLLVGIRVWEASFDGGWMTESFSQSEFASARCYDVLHICVPFDASVDVTEVRKLTRRSHDIDIFTTRART